MLDKHQFSISLNVYAVDFGNKNTAEVAANEDKPPLIEDVVCVVYHVSPNLPQLYLLDLFALYNLCLLRS